jgi:hypothetical protein
MRRRAGWLRRRDQFGCPEGLRERAVFCSGIDDRLHKCGVERARRIIRRTRHRFRYCRIELHVLEQDRAGFGLMRVGPHRRNFGAIALWALPSSRVIPLAASRNGSFISAAATRCCCTATPISENGISMYLIVLISAPFLSSPRLSCELRQVFKSIAWCYSNRPPS